MSKLANLVAACGLFAASFSTTTPTQMSLPGALLGPDCATLEWCLGAHRQSEVKTVHNSA